MRDRAGVLLVLLLMVAGGVMAQPRMRDTSIQVRFYGVSDGLAQSQVTCVYRDSFGLMWFGSFGGLTCYDAEETVSYYRNGEDSTTIGSNVMYNICEGRGGDLWISTPQGVSRFRRDKETFSNYGLSSTDSVGGLVVGTEYVYCDSQGGVWALNSRELFRYVAEEDRFEGFLLPDGMGYFRGEVTVRLDEDSRGNIWVLVGGVLQVFLVKDREFAVRGTLDYKLPEGGGDPVVGFGFVGVDSLVVGYSDRVLLYPSAFSAPEVYMFPPKDLHGDPSRLHAVLLGARGEIFGVSKGRLMKLERNSGDWLCLAHMYCNEQQIGPIEYLGFDLRDAEMYWIPVLNGVVSWSQVRPLFLQYNYTLDGRLLLDDMMISSIYTEDDETVWVGSWFGGITRFDRLRMEIKRYSSMPPLRNSWRDSIFAIHALRDGTLLAASNHALMRYDRPSDAWVNYLNRVEDLALVAALARVEIHDFAELLDGTLCIATTQGVFFYDRLQGEVRTIESLRTRKIECMVYNEQGYLWLGTWGGLLRVTMRDTSIVQYPIVLRDGRTVGGIGVVPLVIRETSDSALLVGTSSGLYKREPGQAEFSSILPDADFGSLTIFSIEEDARGSYWLGTSDQLVEYDPYSGSYQSYGSSDGVRNHDFNQNASFRSKGGILYFGSVNGLLAVDSELAMPSARAVPVIIASCLLHGGSEPYSYPLRLTRQIEVGKAYHSMTLFFSMLDYVYPGIAEYEYMLEGSNMDWEPIYSGNVITLSSLPEGRHVLRYRASNKAGVWVEGLPYTIIVEKPFWSSWLAGLLFVVVCLGILVTVVLIFRRVNGRMRLALRDRQEAIALIERQKLDLQEQHESITDSIEYSKRIQQTILPTSTKMAEVCPYSFVLYRPRDIVSGDFYWLSTQGPLIYLGVVDCTGHGVPGALMSIVGHVHLRSIIVEQQVTSAARVLTLLNEHLIESQSVAGSEAYQNDGLDISLCIIDTEARMIDFAGAFHMLIHVDSHGLEIYRGDPIFTGCTPGAQYTSRRLSYAPEDMIYLFSDGYLDQFGGPKGEKFRISRFQRLIKNIATLPMEQQLGHLTRTLDSWQGDGAQIDDITVVGVRCLFPRLQA